MRHKLSLFWEWADHYTYHYTSKWWKSSLMVILSNIMIRSDKIMFVDTLCERSLVWNIKNQCVSQFDVMYFNSNSTFYPFFFSFTIRKIIRNYRYWFVTKTHNKLLIIHFLNWQKYKIKIDFYLTLQHLYTISEYWSVV